MLNLRQLSNRLRRRTDNQKMPTTALQPSSSERMLEIHAERKSLHAMIGDAARQGAVADALTLSLHTNHVEQLAEWRRLHIEAQFAFDGTLGRLSATWPEPEPPLPEPPAPPPSRHFKRLSSLLAEHPST